MSCRITSDAENARDLAGVVDSARAGSLRIGIVEVEELARRRRSGQIHGAGKDESVIWKIRGVLPDDVADIVDRISVGEIGNGEIEVVELRIRRTDKTMFVRGRIVKQAGDKVLRIYRKGRGLHGRRSRILKRSEKAAGINKCNRRAAVPEIVIAEESALRID